MTKFSTLLEAATTQQPIEDIGFPRPLQSRRGRPPGKRSHPDFEQITAYIRKDIHHAVKITLLKNGRQEFSQLVEFLLQQWLENA